MCPTNSTFRWHKLITFLLFSSYFRPAALFLNHNLNIYSIHTDALHPNVNSFFATNMLIMFLKLPPALCVGWMGGGRLQTLDGLWRKARPPALSLNACSAWMSDTESVAMERAQSWPNLQIAGSALAVLLEAQRWIQARKEVFFSTRQVGSSYVCYCYVFIGSDKLFSCGFLIKGKLSFKIQCNNKLRLISSVTLMCPGSTSYNRSFLNLGIAKGGGLYGRIP